MKKNKAKKIAAIEVMGSDGDWKRVFLREGERVTLEQEFKGVSDTVRVYGTVEIVFRLVRE
jgi:hypothetical protein